MEKQSKLEKKEIPKKEQNLVSVIRIRSRMQQYQ